MFYLTMSFDHRLLGGVAAAQFLYDVANRRETLAELGTQIYFFEQEVQRTIDWFEQ